MTQRAVLLTSDPLPTNADPAWVLYPDVPSSSGHKLWTLLNKRTGASKVEYLQMFERRTACCAPRAMPGLLRSVSGQTLIVIGERLRRVLLLDDVAITPQEAYGATWRPLPALGSQWYGRKRNRDAAALLLDELAAMGRGAAEERQNG